MLNLISVERRSQLSLADFKREFLIQGRPVVIEDCTKSLPCSKWTLEYLLSRVHENPVNVRGKTNSEEYKVGRNYTIRETTFGEYVEDMLKGNSKGQSSYMAVQNISKVFPQLAAECILPDLVEKIHNGPFLWAARAGHYEFCHFDPDEGMLLMIEGAKEIRMFPSSCLDELYPNPLGSKGKTIQSRVDCEKPDSGALPNFSKAPCYHCVLNQGETLYIPAFWWHQVTSLTNAVSVNVFFGDAGDNAYITRHLEGSSWPAFRWWILNIVEQNRPFPSFQRTLQRLRLCIENLLLKQFHERPTEEQLDFFVETIKDYLGIVELPAFTEGGKNPPPLKIRGLRWR